MKTAIGSDDPIREAVEHAVFKILKSSAAELQGEVLSIEGWKFVEILVIATKKLGLDVENKLRLGIPDSAVITFEDLVRSVSRIYEGEKE